MWSTNELCACSKFKSLIFCHSMTFDCKLQVQIFKSHACVQLRQTANLKASVCISRYVVHMFVMHAHCTHALRICSVRINEFYSLTKIDEKRSSMFMCVRYTLKSSQDQLCIIIVDNGEPKRKHNNNIILWHKL